MIKADMKIGDVFEDGGLNFKVLSVNEDGTYISKRTDVATIFSTPETTDKKQTEIVSNDVEPILVGVSEEKPKIASKTPTRTSTAKKTTTRKTVAKKATK